MYSGEKAIAVQMLAKGMIKIHIPIFGQAVREYGMLFDSPATSSIQTSAKIQYLDDIRNFAETVWLPTLTKGTSSWRLNENNLRLHIIPYWSGVSFQSIDKSTLNAWLACESMVKLAASSRNRLLYIFKSILRLALKKGYAQKKQLNLLNGYFLREKRRDAAFIDSEKIRHLFCRLRQSSAPAARAIELLLLTGARKTEIIKARWEDLDLHSRFLTVHGYNGKPKKICLGARTMDILSSLERHPSSPWIFPGRDPSQPVSDIYIFWNDLRNDCGLPGLRIQDLKHNYAHWQSLRSGSSEVIEELIHFPREKCISDSDCNNAKTIVMAGFASAKVRSRPPYMQKAEVADQHSCNQNLLTTLAKVASDAASNLIPSDCALFLGLDVTSYRLLDCIDKNKNPAQILSDLISLKSLAVCVDGSKMSASYPIHLACDFLKYNQKRSALAICINATSYDPQNLFCAAFFLKNIFTSNSHEIIALLREEWFCHTKSKNKSDDIFSLISIGESLINDPSHPMEIFCTFDYDEQSGINIIFDTSICQRDKLKVESRK